MPIQFRKGGEETRDQTDQNRRVEQAALTPDWGAMSVDQKAAFLETMANRLERLGDRLGAETARAWAQGVLAKEIATTPGVERAEPLPNLSHRQQQSLLYQVADWAQTAGGGRYLSAGLLRDGCFNLARDLERQREREGFQR